VNVRFLFFTETLIVNIEQERELRILFCHNAESLGVWFPPF